MRKSESGRSMVEMLGVISVMLIITAAAFLMVRTALQSTSRNSVADEVVQIVSGVHQTYGGFDDYSNLDSPKLFKIMGMSDRNPYGGKYSVALSYGNPRQFDVVIAGLSTSDCMYFLTRPWTDSAVYAESGGQLGGAVAEPGDCTSSDNTIRITYN